MFMKNKEGLGIYGDSRFCDMFMMDLGWGGMFVLVWLVFYILEITVWFWLIVGWFRVIVGVNLESVF